MTWLRKVWDWVADHVWAVLVVVGLILWAVWHFVAGGLRRQVVEARQERDIAKVKAAKDQAALLEEQRAEVLQDARDAAEARARIEGRANEVARDVLQAEQRVERMNAEEVAEAFRRFRADRSTPRLGTKGKP